MKNVRYSELRNMSETISKNDARRIPMAEQSPEIRIHNFR